MQWAALYVYLNLPGKPDFREIVNRHSSMPMMANNNFQSKHVAIRDITDKSAENFSGHLVAPDHEFWWYFCEVSAPKVTRESIELYRKSRFLILNGTSYEHCGNMAVQTDLSDNS